MLGHFLGSSRAKCSQFPSKSVGAEGIQNFARSDIKLHNAERENFKLGASNIGRRISISLTIVNTLEVEFNREKKGPLFILFSVYLFLLKSCRDDIW